MRFIGNGRTVICLALICVGILVWRVCDFSIPLTDQIQNAHKSGDCKTVLALAGELSEQQLANFDICWIVAVSHESLGDKQNAIKYLDKALEVAGHSFQQIRVAMKVADLHEGSGEDSLAIAIISKLIEKWPKDSALRVRAATLLDQVGRRYEANRHHLALVIMGQHTIDDLITLSDRHEAVIEAKAEAVLKDSGSPRYRVLRALIAWRSGKLSDAERLLRAEIADDSQQTEAHALLGLVLLDLGDASQLPRWYAALPDPNVEHPDVWYVKGVWAEALGRREVALQCFQSALRLDPCLRQAIYRLVALSESELPSSITDQLVRRMEAINEYREICKSIFFNGPNVPVLKRLIDFAEALGLLHEAIGWARILNARSGFALVDEERIADLRSRADDSLESGQVNAAGMPVLPWSSPIEVPDWPQPPSSTEIRSSQAPSVTFVDLANNLRLEFQYENGAKEKSGWMIRQSMGGGVAVLDYDQDSWPDIFLPQGASLTPSVNDGLFRSRRAQEVLRTDTLAGLNEDAYSHGAAIGDINNDGFPDVYVANSGVNQLHVNNGDGTFGIVNDMSQSEKWTVSAAIADLDGDGFPDLFDVNYLEWGRPFTELCIDSELGLPRTCPPERFEGESDELHLNLGDGRFRNVSFDVGISDVLGKGLGLVAGDFSGDGRICLFVANDQVPNSFWQVDSSQAGSLQLLDKANVSGLALNGSGESLACMGVAAADVNHDGALDMFVTNFYRQPNTLYLNSNAESFQDATRQSGLFEPGLLKLGFGTQFLDANLDGEQDLVVANGHLDDFTAKGIPFAMHPQLFINHGTMRFQESTAAVAGPYFEASHIARGLATTDFNRDGLTDFAVSHIEEPVALLINNAESHGHFLSVRLVGKLSSRDAFGAMVLCETETKTTWKHLTAGDGYASSNQKDVIIGLGDDYEAKTLRIRWPSGTLQTFSNVEGDRHYAILESIDRLFELPK